MEMNRKTINDFIYRRTIQMRQSEIKRLYDLGWSRKRIALEICSDNTGIDFETAMEVVAAVILKLQRRTIKCSVKA